MRRCFLSRGAAIETAADGSGRTGFAGYSDAQRGRNYRPQSNYGGSSYNSAFSDGYYKGYEVGYYDYQDRRGYRLR